jgi:DNA-binding transcriptional regulator YdaS (Cro superfamily)
MANLRISSRQLKKIKVLSEIGTNKDIAGLLGISESLVKKAIGNPRSLPTVSHQINDLLMSLACDNLHTKELCQQILSKASQE